MHPQRRSFATVTTAGPRRFGDGANGGCLVRKSWTRSRIVAASLTIMALVAGCNDPFSTDDGTHIRLRNSSSFILTAITFKPGEPEIKFARIDPGEVTNYIPVANAYRYGYLDVTVDGARRVIQPIDYVGENYIGEGRFTYVITIDASTLNPGMTMVKD